MLERNISAVLAQASKAVRKRFREMTAMKPAGRGSVGVCALTGKRDL